MKYLKKFEISTLGYENIDWMDLNKARVEQNNIQSYFMEKYPKRVNILNMNGNINSTTLDITLRFAIKRKDKELIDLIKEFKDKLEYIRIEKKASKYNI